MVIAHAGFSGFLGTHIRKSLDQHTFIPLERADLYGTSETLANKLSGCDIVLNTAGYDISVRWTKRNRKRIKDSRVTVTRNLVKAIGLLEKKPLKFICASAIGIYQKDESHSEYQYKRGDDFLSEVVKEWEEAANEASDFTSVINMRIGMVLGNDGGAFPRLYRLFKMGLGAAIGSGNQVYSFVHVADVTRAVGHLIENNCEGIYNLTAPHPVSNRSFTRSIASHAGKPALFRIPAFIMRLIMGRAAIIVLNGQTVYPKKLQEEGYKFTFATIDDAIADLVEEQ